MHVAPGALACSDTDIRTELQFGGLRRRRYAARHRIHDRSIQCNWTAKKLDIQTVVLVEGAVIHKCLHGIDSDGFRRDLRPQHLRTQSTTVRAGGISAAGHLTWDEQFYECV